MNINQIKFLNHYNTCVSPNIVNPLEDSSEVYSNRFDREMTIGYNFILNFRAISKNKLNRNINTFSNMGAMEFLNNINSNEHIVPNIILTDEEKIYLEALQKRKTVRNFKDLKYQQLEKLLLFTFYVGQNGKRNYSSGGALYPIYPLILKKVEFNKYDVYKYIGNSLVKMKTQEIKVSEFITMGGIDNSQFFILLCYDLKKNYLKYLDLGIYMAIYECGSINNLLIRNAQLLGMGLCELGDFKKVGLERVLKIDGLDNHIMSITVGGG